MVPALREQASIQLASLFGRGWLGSFWDGSWNPWQEMRLRGRLHLLRQAAGSRPGDWRASAGLAEIELWRKERSGYGPEAPLVPDPEDREDAVARLERALALAPESERAALHCRLALAHLSFAQRRTAREPAPGKPQARMDISLVGLPARHARAAQQHLAAAQRLEPRNAAYDLLLALVLFSQKQQHAAVRAVERAVRRDTFSLHQREAAESVLRLLRAAGMPRAQAQSLAIWTAFAHAEAGGKMRQLARYLRYMGDDARRRGDHEQAIRLYLLGAAAGRAVESGHQSVMLMLIGRSMEGIGLLAIPLTPAQEQELQRTVAQRSRYGEQKARMLLQNFTDYAASHGFEREVVQPAAHLRKMLDCSAVWRAVAEPGMTRLSVAGARDSILSLGCAVVLFQALCFLAVLVATVGSALRGQTATGLALSLLCAVGLLAGPAYVGWLAWSAKSAVGVEGPGVAAPRTLFLALAPVAFVLALGIIWALVLRQGKRILAGISITALGILSLAYLALAVPAASYRAQVVRHGARVIKVGDAPDIAQVMARLQAGR